MYYGPFARDYKALIFCPDPSPPFRTLSIFSSGFGHTMRLRRETTYTMRRCTDDVNVCQIGWKACETDLFTCST
jgi:hypothetical protein